MIYSSSEKEKILSRIREAFSKHQASLVFSKANEFLIIDWRKPGTGNRSMRYYVDLSRGTLMGDGDLGSFCAAWRNPVSVSNFYAFLTDIGYFMEKIRCSDYKYTYITQDVLDDLESIKQDFLKSNTNAEEVRDDFAALKDIFYLNLDGNTCSVFPDEAIEIMKKYDEDYWETFGSIGKRIHPNVYYWAEGFRMAVKQLAFV